MEIIGLAFEAQVKSLGWAKNKMAAPHYSRVDNKLMSIRNFLAGTPELKSNEEHGDYLYFDGCYEDLSLIYVNEGDTSEFDLHAVRNMDTRKLCSVTASLKIFNIDEDMYTLDHVVGGPKAANTLSFRGLMRQLSAARRRAYACYEEASVPSIVYKSL